MCTFKDTNAGCHSVTVSWSELKQFDYSCDVLGGI